MYARINEKNEYVKPVVCGYIVMSKCPYLPSQSHTNKCAAYIIDNPTNFHSGNDLLDLSTSNVQQITSAAQNILLECQIVSCSRDICPSGLLQLRHTHMHRFFQR